MAGEPNLERRAASELQARLRSGQFVITAEITPPVSTDPAEFLRRAHAAQGPGDRGERHRRRRRQGASLQPGHGALPRAERHRADLPDDLPRPQPARAAGRPSRRAGARHPQRPGARRRRPEGRRPARSEGGVRPRQPRAARHCANRMRTRERAAHRARRSTDRDARWCSAPPTCRSIRRPAGSPKGLQAKIEAGADFVQTQFCMDTGVVAPLHGAAARMRASASRS